MKGKKMIWILTVLAVVAAGGLIAIRYANRPRTQQGVKSITVEIIHSDSSKRTVPVTTERDLLEEVLNDEHLAEGSQGPYGLYIETADGETASYSVDQAWWKLLIDGEQAQQGVGETPIEDGRLYTLEYAQD